VALRQFVHIPKTGGSALRQALGYLDLDMRYPGHRYPISAFPKEDEVITIVRDPVDRFVSAFWHARPMGWESPEPFALAMPDYHMDLLVFRPQVAWIDSDRPLLWVGHTETLEADFERLRPMFRRGCAPLLPRPPAHYPPPDLSQQALDNIRDYYADDYALLARL